MHKPIERLLGLVLLVASTATHVAAQKPAQAPVPQATQPVAAPQSPPFAPVTLDGKTIFRVAALPHVMTATQRATEASLRIREFAESTRGAVAEIEVVKSAESAALVSGETFLIALYPPDAALEGAPIDELAQRNATALEDAIARYRHARSARTIAIRASVMAVAWIVFILLVRAARVLARSLRVRALEWRKRRVDETHVRGLGQQLVDQIVVAVLVLVRLIVALLLLGLFLTLVTLTLRVFPQTGSLADSVIESEKSAAAMALSAVVDYLPSFVFLVIIIVVSFYLLKALRLFFDAISRGDISFAGFLSEWAAPTYSIVRFLVIVFAAVVAFPHLPGGESDALKGVSLFFGVLFSLGSTSAVSNVVAGVILTYMHPYKLGDFVEIGGTTGTVVKRDFLVTRIRTIKNEEVTIPNGAVLGGQVRNYSAMAKEPGLIVHTAITIGYDAPWRRVHELMIAAAKSTEGITDSPAPFVWQTSLNDYHVSYEINAYTHLAAELFRIQADLHRNIQDRFNEAGVEIMSPAFAALRDGNTVTIPKEHRPAGYEAPGFRVERAPDKV